MEEQKAAPSATATSLLKPDTSTLAPVGHWDTGVGACRVLGHGCGREGCQHLVVRVDREGRMVMGAGGLMTLTVALVGEVCLRPELRRRELKRRGSLKPNPF